MSKVSKYTNGNLLSGRTYTQADVTITSNEGLSGFAVTYGTFIPYQTTDGTWRLNMSVRVIYTLTGVENLSFSIAGVTFKSGSNIQQTLVGYFSGSTETATLVTLATPGTDDVYISRVGGASNGTTVNWAGDVELDSKPTWAV